MNFFSIVMVCFCVIGSLNGVTAIKADAGDYLGDYCWNVSNTTLEWSWKLQLGVTHIGSGHCLCSGIITVTDPFYLQIPTHGNMELIGNKIRILLSFPGIRNGHLGRGVCAVPVLKIVFRDTIDTICSTYIIYPYYIQLTISSQLDKLALKCGVKCFLNNSKHTINWQVRDSANASINTPCPRRRCILLQTGLLAFGSFYLPRLPSRLLPGSDINCGVRPRSQRRARSRFSRDSLLSPREHRVTFYYNR